RDLASWRCNLFASVPFKGWRDWLSLQAAHRNLTSKTRWRFVMKKFCFAISSFTLALPLVYQLAAAAKAAPLVRFDWEKAVSLYKQGQFRAAISEFQTVLTEFPEHADSWKFVGLAYYQLKEYDPAIAPLEKALTI